MDKDREAEVEAVSFSAGNPLIAITRGRIHLYRERTRAAPPSAPGPGLPSVPTGTPVRPTDLLVMLAIPSHMSPSEVCSFAAAYAKTITHMRVLREDSHVRYMMVIRFSSPQAAEDFHRDMHGKPFNLLEPDFICRLAFVQEVVFDPPSRAPRNPSPLPLAAPPPSSSSTPLSSSTPASNIPPPPSSSSAAPLSSSTPHAHLSSSGGASSSSLTQNPPSALPSSSANSTPPTALSQSTSSPSSSSNSTLPAPAAPPSSSSPTSTAATVALASLPVVSAKALLSLSDPSIALSELPSCAVCLDRLDPAVSGVITILCNHTFHCSCLARWRTHGTCPVCRYASAPQGEAALAAQCTVCACTHSLWMCLICGNVGCGRYVPGQHAFTHFLETQHTFALELETQRVWDYTGDGYVHRLVANRSDGKVVEVGGSALQTQHSESGEKTDKMAQVWLEYEYLLKTSLDTQRSFFEEQIEKERRAADAKLEALLQDRSEAQLAAQRAEREKKSTEKASAKLTEKLTKVQKEADVMKQLNEALLTNQKDWEKKLKDIEARHAQVVAEQNTKVAELEEQVRDLMFFIDAQKKLASEGASEEELATAQVSVAPGVPSPKLKASPKRRPKK